MERAPTFPLESRRRGAGVAGGSRRSTLRGSSGEIVSSRPYRVGDSTRLIDWKASARMSSARLTDDFVVREHLAEETLRVVLLVDRRPAMGLFPAGLPWLHKPVAVTVAGEMIVASALAARALTGYLDVADPRRPTWVPPRRRQDAERICRRELAQASFTAPEGSLALGFHYLARARAEVPRGSFLFVLSDFLAPPPAGVWSTGVARGWDVVPVIVQDPVWEQSFPDPHGLTLPLASAGGGLQPVRLTRREALARRAANEERLAGLVRGFAERELEPVVLSSEDPAEIQAAFLDWHERRSRRFRR